jgi:flagellar basal-body rod protein FlgF
VGTIATTNASAANMIKGLDGQIRPPPGTQLPQPNQGGRIAQGALEGSNVNATEELISSIELQRAFELNIRMISTAKEIDEAGSRLLRMPEN